MDRRRTGGILFILVVVISSTFALLYFMQPENGTSGIDDTEIELSPLNKLNWWEVAWELSESPVANGLISKLAGFASRFDGEPGFYEAANYLFGLFEDFSLPVSFKGKHDSVVAYQEGYGTDNRALVFGAHLDSALLGQFTGNMGVNNNAAGCGVVMMIADILSQYRLPIDIYYCFFAGNLEILDPNAPIQMFYGAEEVANILNETGVDVIASYNFDELLYYDPEQGEQDRLIVEYKQGVYSRTKYLADLLEAFMKSLGSDILTSVLNSQRKADHQKFWSKGYPAVHITSGHKIPIGYEDTDRLNNPDWNYTQAFMIARAAAATGVYLALSGDGHDIDYKMDSIITGLQTQRIVIPLTHIQSVQISGSIETDRNVVLNFGNTSLVFESEQVSANFTTSFEITNRGLFELAIENPINESISVKIHLKYSNDMDGDGVSDADQYSWPEPDPPLDWDSDGLPDKLERYLGTDVFHKDTDRDEIWDGIEVDNNLDPLRNDLQEDPDEDKVVNEKEIFYGTDPFNSDTDNDGMDDGWEIQYHTNPTVNDATDDPDNDTLTNIEEYEYGSDPMSADGDNDGLPDVYEVEIGTDPLSKDSDQDGLEDRLELLEGLDPLNPDYDVDMAEDGDDANPRISVLVVLGLMITLPVGFGFVYFRKRVV